MKKILTLLAGIVFLIIILVAGGCNPAVPPSVDGPKEVKIYLKAIEIAGEMHLEMYDSNKPKRIVIDTLETRVNPGDTVVWKLKLLSGIKEIDKIGPKTPGKIINKDAEKIPGTKKFGLKIPDDAPIHSEREKYDIVFVDKKYNIAWPIDPYLRIPREQ